MADVCHSSTSFFSLLSLCFSSNYGVDRVFGPKMAKRSSTTCSRPLRFRSATSSVQRSISKKALTVFLPLPFFAATTLKYRTSSSFPIDSTPTFPSWSPSNRTMFKVHVFIYFHFILMRSLLSVIDVRNLSGLGGYLFAVVNPLDTLVQLGVSIGPGGPGQSNVSLYYTQPSAQFSSQVGE